MKKLFKNVNKKAFWICLTISISLIISSFVLPPTGVVDPSVLAAVGEIFAFATLATVISAIERGADITLNKGDMSINIDNPDEIKKEEEQ